MRSFGFFVVVIIFCVFLVDPKIQQTKMFVTCQRFGDLFNVFICAGLAVFYKSDIIKVGSKSWLLTCSSNITLSLPSSTGSALKKELNFCDGYLSLLYVWVYPFSPLYIMLLSVPVPFPSIPKPFFPGFRNPLIHFFIICQHCRIFIHRLKTDFGT